jgi:hypothetical protein
MGSTPPDYWINRKAQAGSDAAKTVLRPMPPQTRSTHEKRPAKSRNGQAT